MYWKDSMSTCILAISSTLTSVNIKHIVANQNNIYKFRLLKRIFKRARSCTDRQIEFRLLNFVINYTKICRMSMKTLDDVLVFKLRNLNAKTSLIA